MAVNIHITIIELNALHTKRQNLFQELDAVIHLLMEAKHWGLRKSRNATSLNSRLKSLDTLKVKIISVTFRRVIRMIPYTTLFRSGRHSRSGASAIGLPRLSPRRTRGATTPARCASRRSSAAMSSSSQDRKRTRLNSSHTVISYAVFCLKKKISETFRRVLRTNHKK